MQPRHTVQYYVQQNCSVRFRNWLTSPLFFTNVVRNFACNNFRGGPNVIYSLFVEAFTGAGVRKFES